MELAFYFSALSVALIVFFLKITAPGAITQFILQALGKLVPLFVILYSGIQIFKYFGAI